MRTFCVPPNAQLSAAPLAGVVGEPVAGTRQVPGKLRGVAVGLWKERAEAVRARMELPSVETDEGDRSLTGESNPG